MNSSIRLPRSPRRTVAGDGVDRSSGGRHASRLRLGLAAAITGVTALVGNVASAQVQIQRLTAPTFTTGARFGDAVAMSPRSLVVGAPGANAVHVFDYVRGTGFAWAQSLTIATSTSISEFGAAIAYDGELIAIGAPGDDAVYVSARRVDGTFDPLVRIQAPVPEIGANFGFSLALSGGVLAVGARFQDGRNGAVHLFTRQADGSFPETGMLRSTSGRIGDEFGTFVLFADDGSTLFVSAPQDDDGGTDAGAVHVFDGSSGAFAFAGKLVTPDAAATDRAGRALSFSGDLLAVGVRNDDDNGTESGSVVLWDRSGGSFTYAGKVRAPDGRVGDLFGHSLALFGDRLLVGAMARDLAGMVMDVGRAYMFERNAAGVFAFVQSYDSQLIQANGRFGSAVALGDRGFAIGGGGSQSSAGEVLAGTTPPHVDAAGSTIEVDPSSIDIGAEALITVVPIDELGVAIGPGSAVVVSTTVGQLIGPVIDQGDGRYTQRISGDRAGTAEIDAVVDGVPLANAASLVVRDPTPSVRVAGQRRDGSIVPFDAIQQAVDAAVQEDLIRILIAPGHYEEVVRISRRDHLVLVGLTSFGPVSIRGLRIERCSDLQVEGLHIQPGSRGSGGVVIGPRAEGITLRALFVEGSRHRRAGIEIEGACSEITIESCRIEGAVGDGIRCDGAVHGVSIHGCAVVACGRTGIELSSSARSVWIAENEVRDNGASSHREEGYGIARHGGGCRRARPEDVTLIRNDVHGNHGRARRGRSTDDFGRYDLMIDPSDDQPPFRR